MRSGEVLRVDREDVLVLGEGKTRRARPALCPAATLSINEHCTWPWSATMSATIVLLNIRHAPDYNSN